MHDTLFHRLNFSENFDSFEIQSDKVQRFYWDLYNDLAYQRHKISDQLCNALLEATVRSYEFAGWQRQVRYKYSLTPLSPKGSLFEPGGRFNIPDTNPTQTPPFPALYIAENKETVLQEAGQKGQPTEGLSSLDLALVKKDSISIVSVGGKLESVIDLHHPQMLKPFLNIIKSCSISKELIKLAKEIGLVSPKVTSSLSSLIDTLLEPDWRGWYMQFDVPANSQIFSQLVVNAGIEGILYPSKFTKKKCIAIYPQNLDSDSYVTIEGEVPHGVSCRLDMNNWNSLKTTF